MYIEIAIDIIEDAISKATSDVNDSLDLLTLFALNAQKGKHLVHVPCLHNNPKIVRALTNIMGRSHVDFLRQSECGLPTDFHHVLQRSEVGPFLLYKVFGEPNQGCLRL